MRRSVFGIWVGLLVFVVSSASFRFVLSSVQNPGQSSAGLVVGFVVVVVVIVAIWLGILRFIEVSQRRQVAAMQRRFPGSMTFPSLPSPTLDATVRLLDPTVQLDAADAITVMVDASGLSLRHRGRDSTALLLAITRDAVLDVSVLDQTAVDGRRGRDHPAIEVLVQSGGGLLSLAFPVFQPDRPFRRASFEQTGELVTRAKAAMAG